jgi:hypothetical protein
LGYQSGWNLTVAGSNNCTFLGANSNVSSTTTSYTQSTAIGANSQITSSNQMKMVHLLKLLFFQVLQLFKIQLIITIIQFIFTIQRIQAHLQIIKK